MRIPAAIAGPMISGLLLLASACLFDCVGNDPVTAGATLDAASNEDANDVGDAGQTPPADAGSDAPSGPCDLTAPFTKTELLPINTVADEKSASLTADERQIVFSTTGREPAVDGGASEDNAELWVSTRGSLAESFGTPTSSWMGQVNVAGRLDAYPALSADGLELVWVVRPIGANGEHELRSSSRTDAASAFGTSVAVSFTGNGPGSNAYPAFPFLLPAGDLYFSMVASPAAADTRSLYRAARTGAATYAEPVAQQVTGAPFADGPFAPTDDELAAYVMYKLDVAIVRRTNAANPWSAPVIVTELSNPAIEFPLWLSPDRCRLYLASNRPGIGGFDLYVASRR